MKISRPGSSQKRPHGWSGFRSLGDTFKIPLSGKQKFRHRALGLALLLLGLVIAWWILSGCVGIHPITPTASPTNIIEATLEPAPTKIHLLKVSYTCNPDPNFQIESLQSGWLQIETAQGVTLTIGHSKEPAKVSLSGHLSDILETDKFLEVKGGVLYNFVLRADVPENELAGARILDYVTGIVALCDSPTPIIPYVQGQN